MVGIEDVLRLWLGFYREEEVMGARVRVGRVSEFGY